MMMMIKDAAMQPLSLCNFHEIVCNTFMLLFVLYVFASLCHCKSSFYPLSFCVVFNDVFE